MRTPDAMPALAATVLREARTLLRLALPIALTQLSLMAMGVVDLLMVGRAGVGAVAALALGNTWKMGTMLVGMGLVFGIDPQISQGHGAGDARRIALALQRGFVLAAGVTVLLAGLWLPGEQVLLWCGQAPETARIAGDYLGVQIPSLPFFMAWVVLRQYLMGRGIVYPALWIAIGANVLNAGLNWVLIFGHLGFPAYGAVGSGMATSAMQAFMPFGLLAWIRGARLHEGAWVPWSRAALDPAGLRRILAVGGPIAFQLAFEIWAFQVIVFWAGWLGPEALAAHSFVFNMISVSFMAPLGIALAAVTRVGNLIGLGRHRDAQLAAWVAFAIAGSVMAVPSAAFLLFPRALGRLYIQDPAVIAAMGTVLPIAATFQLFDGLQVAGGGILRGMGRTRAAALFHLVGFYVLGLPVAWYLAFPRGLGLVGLWWGLALALAAVALAFVAWVARRGPARMAVDGA